MTRVATANYRAEAQTLFEWALSDNDQFDREKDLAWQAQALERHDHSAGRGLLITTTGIADGAVTNPKLAPGSVTRAKLVADIIGPNEIAADAVGASEIAALAVGTSELADNAVTSAKISPLQVGSRELADGGVTAPKMALNSILNAMIQSEQIDDRTLKAGAIEAKLGYTPARANGGVVSGPITVTGSQTQALLTASVLPFTVSLYGAVGAGFAGLPAQANDGALFAGATGPDNMNLAIGAWTSVPLGIRINAINHQLEMTGRMVGFGTWSTRAVGPSPGDTGSGILAGAHITAVVPVGSSGVPTIGLVSEGVAGVAFYQLAGEAYVASTTGVKDKLSLASHTHPGSVGYVFPAGIVALWSGATFNIPAGWTRESNLDGRIPVIDGSIAGQGFAAGNAYGASWAHGHSMTWGDHHHSATNLGVGGSTGPASGTTHQYNVVTPNPASSDPGHTHDAGGLDVTGSTDDGGGSTGPTSSVSWIPPMFCYIAIKSV